MSIRQRIIVTALSLSAIGLVQIVTEESFVSKAMIPTKGDRPTVGFGSTFRDDGTPVRMGDTITPQKALARTQAHIAKDERGLQKCVTGAMNQTEYDLLVNFSYQYGVAATCKSGIVRNVNSGDYVQACKTYNEYRFSQKRDCSLPQHWGPQGCKGVWLRNQERMATCMAAQ